MKRRFGAGKVVMIVFFVAAGIALFSFIVMSLWNAILPGVIHVNPITFWQALGILVLSKILFSGFGRGGGWHHKKQQWRQRMHEKWQAMTPEERIKFKQEWKNRCGPGAMFFREKERETPNTGSEAGSEKS